MSSPRPDLRVSLGPLTLANPILVAAGTYGYGLEFARAVPVARLGGLITKTLTREPIRIRLTRPRRNAHNIGIRAHAHPIEHIAVVTNSANHADSHALAS